MLSIVVFLLCGSLVGMLAGIFGIGGGIIIVPLLEFLLPYQGIPKEYAMHVAAGTSLTIVALTAASSAWAHKSKLPDIKPILFILAAGCVLGTILGALFANFLPGNALRIIFGLFLSFIALRIWLNRKAEQMDIQPSKKSLATAGVGIGMISALIGLGGGVLIVPYLQRYKIPIQKAAGISAFCIIPVTVIGSITFMLTGQHAAALPLSTGYIYWPAFLGICATSVIFTRVGVKWAGFWSESTLKKAFCMLLLATSLEMLIKSFW